MSICNTKSRFAGLICKVRVGTVFKECLKIQLNPTMEIPEYFKNLYDFRIALPQSPHQRSLPRKVLTNVNASSQGNSLYNQASGQPLFHSNLKE